MLLLISLGGGKLTARVCSYLVVELRSVAACGIPVPWPYGKLSSSIFGGKRAGHRS